MPHLEVSKTHRYIGAPVTIQVTVDTDQSASDVESAELRHEDLDTVTNVSAEDVDGGVELTASLPDTSGLSSGTKRWQMLADFGDGLDVVGVGRITWEPRLPSS